MSKNRCNRQFEPANDSRRMQLKSRHYDELRCSESRCYFAQAIRKCDCAKRAQQVCRASSWGLSRLAESRILQKATRQNSQTQPLRLNSGRDHQCALPQIYAVE